MPYEFEKEMMRILGIDSKRVTKVVIVMETGFPVTIAVTGVPDLPAAPGMDDLERITKRYRLMETGE